MKLVYRDAVRSLYDLATVNFTLGTDLHPRLPLLALVLKLDSRTLTGVEAD
jgi:hypothetical protein